MIAPGLPAPGYEFVERSPLADRHHVEARLAKGLQVAAGVGQEVDGTVRGGLFGSLDARGVVSTVASRGFRSINGIGPDDIGVAVPGGAERVGQGEVPPPPLDQK